MANLQAQLQSYVEASNTRLANIEINIERKIRPDAPRARVDLNSHAPVPQQQNLDLLFRWV